MSARPLMGATTAELDAVFDGEPPEALAAWCAGKPRPEILAVLQGELIHRHRPKAVDLLARVVAAISGNPAPAKPAPVKPAPIMPPPVMPRVAPIPAPVAAPAPAPARVATPASPPPPWPTGVFTGRSVAKPRATTAPRVVKVRTDNPAF